MAFFTGWFSRGKAVVSRVVSSIREGATRTIHHITGQPVSRTSISPVTPPGTTDLPDHQKRELLETGQTTTPTGQIHIDESKIDKSVAGRIPQQWKDELDWKEPKITGIPSIFGEPFHYQVEFKVSVRQRDENGTVYHTFSTQYYTVTSDRDLSREEVVARGLELAEIDYNTDDPYFGGTVIGIGEIQPVVYTA